MVFPVVGYLSFLPSLASLIIGLALGVSLLLYATCKRKRASGPDHYIDFDKKEPEPDLPTFAFDLKDGSTADDAPTSTQFIPWRTSISIPTPERSPSSCSLQARKGSLLAWWSDDEDSMLRRASAIGQAALEGVGGHLAPPPEFAPRERSGCTEGRYKMNDVDLEASPPFSGFVDGWEFPV